MKKKVKKTKKYAEGGLAGIAQAAQDLMGQVDDAANTIKTGTGSGGGVEGGLRSAIPVLETAQSKFVNLERRPQVQPRMQPAFLASSMGYGGGLRNFLGFKKGGAVKSASKRADGCAVKGKTRGKIV